jgi:hypothetical protein
VLLGAVLLSGCAATVATAEQLRARATFDLQCPLPQVEVVELDEMTRGVRGCGKQLTYVEVCDNRVEGWRCTWVINSPAWMVGPPAGRQAPPPPNSWFYTRPNSVPPAAPGGPPPSAARPPSAAPLPAVPSPTTRPEAPPPPAPSPETPPGEAKPEETPSAPSAPSAPPTGKPATKPRMEF